MRFFYTSAYLNNSDFSKHFQFLLVSDQQYPSDEAILPGIKLNAAQELFRKYQSVRAV